MAKPKKNPDNLPVDWEKELAEQARIAAEMEASAAGGQFFSTRGGVLSWNETPLPASSMVVVILDHVLENVFYEGDFDPENPSQPVCFAFGRDALTIKPHEVVVKNGSDQHDFCQGCPQNQWGTADKGKGKACRNTRRLALIPAGEINPKTGDVAKIFEDPAHYENAGVGYLKLPVTGVKAFANFVQSVSATFGRPPHGIISRIRVNSHPKNQLEVIVEPYDKCSNDIMPVLMRRHKETQALIEFPYALDDGAAEEKKPAKKKDKPPVKRGRKY